jgi:hypothetical protein
LLIPSPPRPGSARLHLCRNLLKIIPVLPCNLPFKEDQQGLMGSLQRLRI